MTTKRLTAEDLAVIEARANAATCAPWRACSGGGCQCGLVWSTPCDVIVSQPCRDEEIWATQRLSENAAFIAAARTDVPDLIAEVRALTAERDELRAIVEGRKVAPTLTEIAAHCASGGRWRSIVPGEFILSTGDGDAEDARQTSAVQQVNAPIVKSRGVVWWAITPDGRPCAWPKVTP